MIQHDPVIAAAREALKVGNWPLLAALATVLQELDIWQQAAQLDRSADLRACWKPGDQEHDHDQCTDANRERTALVPLIRRPAPDRPVYARAHCSSCRTLIAAHGWRRGPLFPGDPASPAGPAEPADWRHTMPSLSLDLNPNHEPTPDPQTIIGLLPPFADARPGRDGDTRDWAPQEPQSHAPQVCRCGQPAVWREGVWRHLDPAIDVHHAPNLSASDR
jgi:hypothetical protein